MLLIAFTIVSLASHAMTLHELRTLFENATKKEVACQSLIKTLSAASTPKTAINKGYLGATYVMMAIYVNNPFSKLSNFNKGKEILEQAIKQDPSNIELMYLRFAIQTNVPSMLNYYKHIPQDRKLIITAYPLIKDAELKTNILRVFKKYSGTTAVERKVLNY